MKKLLPIIFILILSSCSQGPEVKDDQINYRNDVPYLLNTQEPFTGVVVKEETGWYQQKYENGKTTEKKKYKKGELIETKMFDYRGQLKSLDSYKNGKLHGPKEWYSENGELYSSSIYENGGLKSEESWDDGVLSSEREFSSSKNRVIVRFKDYHRNGQVELIGEMVLNSTREFIPFGPYKRFDEEGNDISNSSWTENEEDGSYCERRFKNGYEEGTHECFEPTGKISRRFNYKEGKYHGSREFYNEKGKPREISNYKEGKRNGLFESFHYTTGEVREHINYRDDKLHGLYKEFHKNGELKYQGYFESHRPIGEFKKYSYSGEVLLSKVCDWTVEEEEYVFVSYEIERCLE